MGSRQVREVAQARRDRLDVQWGAQATGRVGTACSEGLADPGGAR